MLLQKLLGLKDGARLLRPNTGPGSRCRDEAIPGLNLVALCSGLPHRLDRIHDLAQLHETRLCLFQSGLCDL